MSANPAIPRHPSTRRPGMSEAYWQHVRDVANSGPDLTADQRDVIRRLAAPAVKELAEERAA